VYTSSRPGFELITVHEKLSNGSLKELCSAYGGDCGGTSVDNAFYQIFAKLVGAPLMNEMKREEPEAYLDIFREFEAACLNISTIKLVSILILSYRSIILSWYGEDWTSASKSSLRCFLHI
jgi:hypothetical protein